MQMAHDFMCQLRVSVTAKNDEIGHDAPCRL
jgi:hypothetical protein